MNQFDVENTLRELAPDDLEMYPLYIVLDSQGAPRKLLMVNIGGQTGLDLDLALREWLGDRWQGRGPAIYLNDTHVAENIHPDDQYRCLMCWAVHELGHVLQQPIPDDEEEDSWITTPQVAEGIAAVSSAYNATAGPTDSTFAVPWFGHNAVFIRNVIHLHHRAAESGYFDLPLSAIFDSTICELSEIEKYRDCLLDEPVDMADADFATIRSTSPPVRFRSLWLADVHRWHDSHKDISPRVFRQVVAATGLFTPHPKIQGIPQ